MCHIVLTWLRFTLTLAYAFAFACTLVFAFLLIWTFNAMNWTWHATPGDVWLAGSEAAEAAPRSRAWPAPTSAACVTHSACQSKAAAAAAGRRANAREHSWKLGIGIRIPIGIANWNWEPDLAQANATRFCVSFVLRFVFYISFFILFIAAKQCSP